jgi:hypothetical protein
MLELPAPHAALLAICHKKVKNWDETVDAADLVL